MQHVTAQDVFAGMKQNFDAVSAAGVNAVVTYELAGDHGGAWTLRVANGKLEVDEGIQAAAPDATVQMSAQDFVQVALGKVNPATAFMTGQIKIHGNLLLAQKMQTLFHRPHG